MASTKILARAMNAARRLRLNAGIQTTDDRHLLEKWRDAPLTCKPQTYETYQQAIALSLRHKDWVVVSYRGVLRHVDPSKTEAMMFDARRAMLHFERVCPESVALITSDWQAEKREMRVGDCFVQRINLLPFGILKNRVNQLVMDKVVHIYDTPEKCGFAVATTDQHDEIGEHTVWIRKCNEDDEGCDDENDLVLESIAASSFHPHVFGPGLWYARWLQNRAHMLSKGHLGHSISRELMLVPEEMSLQVWRYGKSSNLSSSR